MFTRLSMFTNIKPSPANNKIKMANNDTSKINELDEAANETNISTPAQDTDNVVVAITSNSDGVKYIPGPISVQASSSSEFITCILFCDKTANFVVSRLRVWL